MSNHVKIVIIGPQGSGKTYLSNFLADATEISTGTYRPTKGVRILEFEAPNIRTKRGLIDVAVELWDCSGDHRYELCWPSMQKNASGVMLVYDPDEQSHKSELENWFLHYVKEQGLSEDSCLAVSHRRKEDGIKEERGLEGILSNLEVVQSNVDEDPDSFRESVHHFLQKVVIQDNAKRDKEELSIIQ